MTHLEKACESVDASVFNGDMLFDDVQRAMLKDYLDRWNHAVSQHEGRADSGLALTSMEIDGGIVGTVQVISAVEVSDGHGDT